MTLLGIESATELVGVCVANGDEPRACIWVTGTRRHTETLAPAVAHVLELAGISLEDLTAIAVDIGPGLFTGLRVGVATAKALAQGLGIGLVGIGSLSILGSAAHEAGWPGTVMAVIDARRSEVFAARYRPAPAGSPLSGGVEELTPPRVLRPEVLAQELAEEASNGPILVVGDGARRYAELFGAIPGVSIGGRSLAAPPPATLVTLAAARLAAGHPAEDPMAVVPDYLRGPDARINWRQRSQPAGATGVAGDPAGEHSGDPCDPGDPHWRP